MILAFALLQPQAARAERVVNISTGEWPPYAGVNLPNNGATLDIIRQAFNRQGYDVRYEFYPWERAFDLVVSAKVDASAYWYPLLKRKKVAFYSQSIHTENMVFIHLKNKHIRPWNTLSDLKEYRIGATLGVSYTQEFWKLAKKGTLMVEMVNSDALNIRKVLDKRIDLFATYEIYYTRHLTKLLKQEDTTRLAITKPFVQSTTHVIFPKKRQGARKLLDAFNLGLAAIKADGTFQRIMQRMHERYYDPQ